MRTEWAVMADPQRARIFARVGSAAWQDIRSLSRGAAPSSNGREVRLPLAMQRYGAAAAAAPSGDEDFLDHLARELRAARKRGDFDALIIIAPETLLEPLKAALDPATRRTLVASAAENLLGLSLREARRQLARRF